MERNSRVNKEGQQLSQATEGAAGLAAGGVCGFSIMVTGIFFLFFPDLDSGSARPPRGSRVTAGRQAVCFVVQLH